MIKYLLLAAGILASATLTGFASNTTEVDWTNIESGTTYTLFNNSHTALSAGASGVNQDGDLIELGYFTSASPGSEFSGTFVPLTETTTIGDSYNLAGDPAGSFGFNSYFLTGSTSYVYNPGSDSGAYTTNSAISITESLPAANQILAIRFFSTTTGTSGYYNTVSADSWDWQVPTANTSVVTINMVVTGSNSLVWQDPSNPFDTSIAVAVPEPTTLSLIAGAIGIAAVASRRRS